jgi:hypothetical protein
VGTELGARLGAREGDIEGAEVVGDSEGTEVVGLCEGCVVSRQSHSSVKVRVHGEKNVSPRYKTDVIRWLMG